MVKLNAAPLRTALLSNGNFAPSCGHKVRNTYKCVPGMCVYLYLYVQYVYRPKSLSKERAHREKNNDLINAHCLKLIPCKNGSPFTKLIRLPTTYIQICLGLYKTR